MPVQIEQDSPCDQSHFPQSLEYWTRVFFFPSLLRRINPGNTSCDLSFSLSLSCRGTVEARFVYVFVLGILFSGSKDLLRSQIITADAKLKSRGLWEIYSGLVLLVSLLFRAHNLPVLCCCLLIQTFMAQFIWKKLHYDAAQTTIMHYWFGQAFFFFQVGDKISDELMHVRFLRTVCHCGMNFPRRHRRAQVCRWLSRPSVCSVWKKKVFQLFVKIYFGFWTTSEYFWRSISSLTISGHQLGSFGKKKKIFSTSIVIVLSSIMPSGTNTANNIWPSWQLFGGNNRS